MAMKTKKLEVVQQCMIANRILGLLREYEVTFGNKIRITVTTTKSGAVKDIEIMEE